MYVWCERFMSSEKRVIIFPIGEAFRFSLESIRKRFTRAIITALSIMLGIAFFVTLRTMGSILREVGGTGIAIEAYQYWMAVIALLVCGVGIINSMLMSVTERYQEIGTMKCLGATDRNVLALFLIEAMLLGVFGGLVGSAIGFLAAVIMYGIQVGFEVVMAVPIIEYLLHFAIAIVTALGLSVIAAAYPAYYAARLNPADALRYVV